MRRGNLDTSRRHGSGQGGPHFPATTPSELLTAAVERLRERDFEAAKRILNQIDIGSLPAAAANVVISLHALADFHLGQSSAALEVFRRTGLDNITGLGPWNELAVYWKCNGSTALAIRTYRAIVKLVPDFAAAHFNLALALDGDRAALSHLERASALSPAHAEPHVAFGTALLENGRNAESVNTFERALQIDGSNGEAWFGRGNAMFALGQLEKAIESYRSALELQPDRADVLVNWGNALRESGDLEEAERHYQQAMTLDVELAEAPMNLALVHKMRGHLPAAGELMERAISLRPDVADQHTNLGNVHREMGNFEAARFCYRTAARLLNNAPLYALREATLFPRIVASRQAFEELHDQLADYVEQLAENPTECSADELVKTATEPPFDLQFHHGNVRPIKEAYARLFTPHFAPLQPQIEHHVRERPRIGLVVTKSHERIFVRSMKGVLAGLGDEQFELAIVHPQTSHRLLVQELQGLKVGLLGFSERFSLAMETISEANFDILYYWEVGTDGMNYFLPFVRLAPVQCTSWGIQVTSGIPTLDYYLSSELVEPADGQSHYSERLLLSTTLLTYQYPTVRPQQTQGRDHFGLNDAEHIYACPQNLGKIHPDFDASLREILERDSAARIVLTGDDHGIWSERLRVRLRQTMPEVANRVTILPRMERDEYLALMTNADVILDPPHFGGVNTTYDAMGLGKVLVTSRSAFHRGRYAAGCYEKMGLGHLVAQDEQDYVQMALGLAEDADRRHELEREIAARSELLFCDEMAINEHARLFKELGSREFGGSQ